MTTQSANNNGDVLTPPVMISLTSGKGGVGKTSLAVNLAFALSTVGRRVLLVDGDLGLANVDVLLRINVKRTLRDILDNGEDPLDVLVPIEEHLFVLPASSGAPQMLQLGAKEQAYFEQVLRRIASGFEFILFDTAAGIGTSVLWLNAFADHNIVVVTPDPTSMTDAYALIKVMSKEYDRRRFHVLLNHVREEKEARDTFNTLANVATRFLDIKPELLGVVPHDAEVAKAVREQIPFLKRAPQSKAARAVRTVAQRMVTMGNG